MSITIQMPTGLSLIQTQRLGLDSFYLIDIRSPQSYQANHIPDSYNLQTQSQILQFLDEKGTAKPLLLVCFSSHKAQKMAKEIAKNTKATVHYLDCGIMELAESFHRETTSLMSSLDVSSDTSILDTSIFVTHQDSHNTELTQKTESTQYNIAQQNPALSPLEKSIRKDYQQSSQGNVTPPPPLVEKTLKEIESKYLSSTKAFVIAFSGGKDSTCVLQLFYEMLLSLPLHKRRPSFVLCSNTLVEAPHIEKFMKSVLDSINAHAKAHNIPLEIIEVKPNLKDDFWVNLIGKGYPSPTRTFRWCTDRLKITPAKQTIATITKQFGSVILCLGTRKQESSNRKKSMEKRILTADGYSLHHDFPDTLCYSPIAEWSTDDVWAYLISHKPKWDKDHSELFRLYAKASGDECQFITDLSQSSCGGSRFGCWVCTVVSEDKSMRGFIESGEENLKSLHDFRNYIKVLREDSKARADYGRNGRAVYKVGALGPFLSHIRLEILHKLLQTEQEFIKNGGSEIITDSQILAIQNEWDTDFDFNKSAIRIAQKFHRLQEIGMQETGFIKAKVLHKEILEEVANKELDSKTLESFIAKAIEIYNNANTKGTNNVYQQITQEIQKLLSDKTAKSSIATMEA